LKNLTGSYYIANNVTIIYSPPLQATQIGAIAAASAIVLIIFIGIAVWYFYQRILARRFEALVNI